MPNLRTKTWTTTTPANVADAQYWEDHLISDEAAAKAASSVQTVNSTAPDANGNVDVVALPAGGTVGQVLTKKSSTDGDADWETPASSGHTILDDDGTTMTQQQKLQFTNADVTNDSVNGKTVVDCKGAKGDPGQAATINVGTVTTLPAGSDATVTNSGTTSASVFNFGIPKGADGSGSGDMAKSDYDSDSSVLTAGGIAAYVAGHAYSLPTASTSSLGGIKVGTNLSIDENGIFVSSGKVGAVTAQLVYNGEVKGSATINIVVPTAIAFGTAQAYTVPFGESVNLNITATYDVFDVTLKASDYTITFGDNTFGVLDGTKYTAGTKAGKTDMTVTLVADTTVSKTIPLTVGKGSEVVFSFEDGTAGANLNNWVVKDHEGKYTPYAELSVVNSETGMVHNGNSALAVHMAMDTRVHGGEGYAANSITWVGDRILLENATAIGMWIYIPEEATQTEIALNYVWYNDNGVQQRTTPDLCLNDTFNGIESSGWYYLSVPVSKSIAYIEDATSVAASQGYKRNFFLKFYVTNSGNEGDESSYFGDITYYIDDITIDYSEAVADRIAPTFSSTYAQNLNSESETALSADDIKTVGSGNLNFYAEVTDNLAIDADSAVIYVDGKAIATSFKNGKITGEGVVF